LENKKIEKNEYYADLPDFDETMNFNWRVRIEIREALNVPLADGMLPQVIVETGWSNYKDALPEEKRIYRSAILNSTNPEWNQTILITNPSHITEAVGFVMLVVKDSHNLEDIFKLYIPIESMGRFLPYNICLVKDRQEGLAAIQFFFSIVLEAPLDNRDRLLDVIVSDITFEPLVVPFKQMNLATVFNSENEPKLQFYNFKPEGDSI
jgi:hypothetical protein